MDSIKETIQIYERLRSHKYKITVEDTTVFNLSFLPQYYHHLAGFQHITDVAKIANPVHGDKNRFYRMLKNGQIDTSQILGSEKYNVIKERVNNFAQLEELVSPGDGRIIVRYNNTLAQSVIDADFMLYRYDGNPFSKEQLTYYHLFIGLDRKSNLYYPTTYIVEHSKQYLSRQIFLDCKIELI